MRSQTPKCTTPSRARARGGRHGRAPLRWARAPLCRARARQLLRLAVFVCIGASQLLDAAPAAAQLRYIASVDVRERYNSNVFDIGRPEDEHYDFITEFEPAFRLYYNSARHLLTLHYLFVGQVFPITSERPEEIAYANRLDLGYSFLMTHRTEFAIYNHFTQGTDRVAVPGRVSQQTGFGANFTPVNDYIRNGVGFGVSHQVSDVWTFTPMLTGEIYIPYNVDLPDDGMLEPVKAYNVTLTTGIGRQIGRHVLGLEADGAWMMAGSRLVIDEGGTQRPDDADIHAYLFGAMLNWRWQISEMWDSQIGAGVRVRHAEDEWNPEHAFETSPGPAAGAFIRYRRGPTIMARLDYGHGWEMVQETGITSAVEVDAVGIAGFWLPGDFAFDLGAHFRYMRTARVSPNPDQENTLGVISEFVASYLIVPGLSVEVGYTFEFLQNRLRAPNVDAVNDSGMRHTAFLGVSFAWPPPPPQDVRLNRRESEYEPVFRRGGQGGVADQPNEPGGVTGEERRRWRGPEADQYQQPEPDERSDEERYDEEAWDRQYDQGEEGNPEP